MQLDRQLRPYRRYFADLAHKRYLKGQSQKGCPLKIDNESFYEFIENIIMKKKYSPYSALQAAQNKGFEVCSLSTLYNYIRRGLFKRLRMVHCPAHCSYKRGKKKVQVQKQPKGRSIETRNITRSEFGHWEMDTVIGKNEKGECLLVLTERKTRAEIVLKISSKTQTAVASALDALERKYGSKFYKIFKSITIDNGCEFLNQAMLEKSCRRKKNRTTVYYCHPYSSYERGSNENANKLIRRHIPKGQRMEQYTAKEIADIADWINDYPRNLLGGKTARQAFAENISELFQFTLDI